VNLWRNLSFSLMLGPVPAISGHCWDWDAELNAKIASFVLVLLAWGVPSAAAKEPLRKDDRVVLIKASPGCTNRQEFDRLVDLAQSRNAVRFAEYMASHNCSVLRVGTTASSEDWAFSGRAMCIRPLGAADCLWIPGAAAQKIGQTVPAVRSDD
jgi:hypothetical protein